MATEVHNYRDRKYRDDRAFQRINRKYLTLQENEIRANNEHLKMVIENVCIPLMRQDELFNVLYKRIMYGGSFYKGTKYGKPEEFDLDFIIKLPINYSKITIDTNHDNYGFVKIRVNTDGPMHPNWEKYKRILSSWLTRDNYLDQNKFRAWIEGIFARAFSKLPRRENAFEISHNGRTYIVTLRKTGPAFTMIIHIPGQSVIDVDLVPCLEFDDVPLNNGYRRFNGYRRTWMVVAKPLSEATPNHNILWRLCFYEQEKEMLKGDLKPVIRMMKKFRDTMRWKSIASYYIETIFYHELERNQNDLNSFLRAPKTWLFMHGLRKLKQALDTKNLPYFWHANYNLIGKVNRTEIQGYANRLNSIINKIDNNIESDPFILIDVVLDPYESRETRAEVEREKITNNYSSSDPEDFATPQKDSSSCTIS